VFGSRLLYFSEVDSTNRIVRELAPEEWRTGVVAITDFQTAGRGRGGRGWSSPAQSGLLMSTLLELPAAAEPADAIMFAALAVADALRISTGMDVDTKWPNDLLVKGRKVCGMLAESVNRNGRRWAIVGIGINVLAAPTLDATSRYAVTSLSEEAGSALDRESLAVGVFRQLDLWYRCLTQGPDGVFAAWSARLRMIGSDIIVQDGSGEWRGRALGARRDGALLVRHVDGTLRSVHAGDVSIGAAEGFTAT